MSGLARFFFRPLAETGCGNARFVRLEDRGNRSDPRFPPSHGALGLFPSQARSEKGQDRHATRRSCPLGLSNVPSCWHAHEMAKDDPGRSSWGFRIEFWFAAALVGGSLLWTLWGLARRLFG